MIPDAATLGFLNALKVAGRRPLWELTAEELRASIRAASLQLAAPSTEVHDVADRKMPVPGGEVGLRIYTPRPASEDRPFPIVVHLHGAGFVAGDLDTHDSIARFHCKHADAVVIAVDYRLAPEHPFPAAVDDAYAAVEWAVDHARELHGDARRIAVLGDSAGGNLAAVVCQLAKARHGPRIGFQALVCPAVDFSLDAAYPSRSQFGGGDFSCRIATWSSSDRATSPTCSGRRATRAYRRCSPTIWPDCRRRWW
jgi:acetyl esterase